jgi:ribosomal protein S21
MNIKQYKIYQTIVPGSPNALRVIKRKDARSDIEYALRAWKRQVKDAGILKGLKDRSEYIKPTTERREQKKRRVFLAKLNTLRNS